jgi:Domain of unknown function (DUF4082)
VAVITQPQRGLTTGFQKGITAKSLRVSSLSPQANQIAQTTFFTTTTPSAIASPNTREDLYPTNPTPSYNNPDTLSYTLGTKVRFSQAGFITGVKFYKRPGDTNNYHVISVFDQATGLELARGSTANETTSGWQEALFAQPLAVVANKTYVTCFQANGGGFGVATGAAGFQTSSLVSGSITALQEGTDGPNGVFFTAPGPSDIPTFPTENFSSSNYYVGPIFVVSTVTKNLTFSENENSDTLSAITSQSKNLIFGEIENRDTLTANAISNKNLAFAENENRDTLAFNIGSGPTKDLVFGLVENADRVSQVTSKAVPISMSVNENRDFTGQAIVPLITDLTGADWNSGTATGSALSEVQVVGVNLEYVTQFLANGTTMPAENLGTSSPTVILPASPGPYTITMVGLGSTGIPITFSKNLTIAVVESKDTLTTTAAQSKNLIFTEAESKDISMLAVSKNAALIFGEVESKDILTMTSAGTSVKNLTFSLNESADKLTANSTQSKNITFGDTESKDVLTASVTRSKNVAGSFVENRDTLSATLTSTKSLVFGETENRDSLTAVTTSAKSLVFGEVESKDILSVTTVSNKSITFVVNESQDRLTATLISNKSLTGGFVETLDKLTANVTATAFKSLTFNEVESKDVLTWTTGVVTSKNLTFVVNESKDTLNATPVSNKSLVFGEVESKNTLIETVAFSKNITFGEVESQDKLTETSVQSKNLIFGHAENKDALSETVTFSKNITFGEVENRDALTWITGAAVFKNLIFGINETQDKLSDSTTSSKNLTAGFVETQDKLTAQEVSTKPLGYMGVESQDKLTANVTKGTAQPTENLYPTNPIPSTYPESTAYTFGVKVQFNQPGLITGVKFYKASFNLQTVHYISVWDKATGVELVRGTTSGETASGWQEGLFATPLVVQAGKTYTVSYHISGGGYAFQGFAFDTALTSGSITALANGNDGGNGVFQDFPDGTLLPAFPNQTFNNASYFVSPLFVPGTAAFQNVVGTFNENRDRLAMSVARASSAVPTIVGDYGSGPGGTYLVLTGTGFLGTTGGLFAGIPLVDFTVIDATHLGVTVPYGNTLTGSFSITNNIGTGSGGTFTRLPDLPTVPSGGTGGGRSFRKRQKRKYPPLVFAPLPDLPTEILVEQKGKTKEIAVHNEEGTARDIAEILEMLDALDVIDILDNL